MRLLSEREFVEDVFDPITRWRYRWDNLWVGDWSRNLQETWYNAEVMTNFIQCAYKLYAATANNRLKLTILGGTEIRKNEELIRSFGVTGANGIQDAITAKHVQRILVRRRIAKQFPRSGDGVDNPRFGEGQTRPTAREKSASVGSILSEKNWTPILNDALIIGAITGGQEFALGLESAEKSHWKLKSKNVTKREIASTSKFGPSQKLITAWREFMNENSSMFFDGDLPRVLTRELLGLATFGYKPAFSWINLSFRPNHFAGRPSFTSYLDALNAVGFEAKQGKTTDKRRVMEAVSLFLFDDRNAIQI